MHHILVVDDERAVRVALEVNLSKAGYIVSLSNSAEHALELLREQPVNLVLTDLMMPETDGLELLAQVREKWPSTEVVMMTGHGTVERAVDAMKGGAHDFIIKPVSKAELLAIVERALRSHDMAAKVARLEAEVSDRFGFDNLVGSTPAMQSVYEQVSAVADSNALVLLTGPTGTGKELIGHAIHYRSPRRDGAFVQVNCGALPAGLLESELFGHEKGAFTGAIRQHHGKFEQADGGTLMLDEVGEMPLETQVKLLRILESGELQRVGGSRTLQVDVRVIAATNRDLRQEVREGRFREDLFYRLNVFHIELPPLRDRQADIPLLVDHFLHRFAERHKKDVESADPSAIATLMAHRWPGNVRELEHVVERAVILAQDRCITSFNIPEPLREEQQTSDELVPSGQNIADVLREHERALVVQALRLEKGVQARAARRLGVSRANLNYRIQKLGIIIKDIIYE